MRASVADSAILFDGDGENRSAIVGKCVPLTRCCYCQHLRIENGAEVYAVCEKTGIVFKSFGERDTRTWWCADGKRKERYEEPEISVASLGDGVEEIRSVEAMRGCGAMWDIECGRADEIENVNAWAEELKETMPDESDETREELKREYCPGALLEGDAPKAALCDGDEPDDKECEKCWNSRGMRCRLLWARTV